MIRRNTERTELALILVLTCGNANDSSRNLADYEEILEERRSFDIAPITPQVTSTAVHLQHELARRGQHRVPIPDLIISAVALLSGLVVLHYDSDFERIAAAGGAPHEWVVPQGSV